MLLGEFTDGAEIPKAAESAGGGGTLLERGLCPVSGQTVLAKDAVCEDPYSERASDRARRRRLFVSSSNSRGSAEEALEEAPRCNARCRAVPG